MYNAESIMEKWAPLLDAEGVDPIKDAHRRSVTAVLLENQEKFLQEQSAFENGTSMLTEAAPTNSGNAVGASGAFGAGSADAGLYSTECSPIGIGARNSLQRFLNLTDQKRAYLDGLYGQGTFAALRQLVLLTKGAALSVAVAVSTAWIQARRELLPQVLKDRAALHEPYVTMHQSGYFLVG